MPGTTDNSRGVGEILAAVTPIFLVVAAGFALTRGGLFSRDDMSVLSRFVVKVALPLLVFMNVVGRAPSEIFHPAYLLNYAVAALIMFGLGYVWVRVSGGDRGRSPVVGLLMSSTNNGFIGFAMFLILIPEFAGAAVGMDMLVDNVLIIPLFLFLCEQATNRGVTVGQRLVKTLRGVILHPMVIAIILALVTTAVGWELPTVLSRAVGLVAQASSGVALFSVGGMLVGLRLGGMLSDVVATAAGKLIVMPAISLGLIFAYETAGLPALPHELKVAALLTGALPTFSIAPALADPYGHSGLASASMMTQVVLSAFSMTAWLAVAHTLGWM